MAEKENGRTTERGEERKRGQGVRYVYETLRDEIIDLTMPPGSAIDEVRLSERLSVSRTPIREALVRLSVEGLVTTLPNRSTIVSNIDFMRLPSFFEALTLMYRVTTRLAAEHRSDEDLVVIRAHQGEYLRAVEDRNALDMIATNRQFHVAIAQAGGNHYYTQLFSRLLDEGRRILRLYYASMDDQLPRRYVEEHDAMIEAIESHDIDAADRHSQQHADQIVRQIQQLLTSDKRRTIPL